jgi:3-oxoacyl-[acyl-carrier-protein] synthase-3
MNAILKATTYLLPSIKVTNDDLSSEFPDWSPEKISKKTGIFERAITSENQFVSDLAIDASLKLFKEFDINSDKIDFLLLCTQSPDYFLPTTACIVQDKLGLSKTCGALDFNLGCSGFVYGLSLAKGLIYSKSAKNILLITAETYSKHIHTLDKSNRSIFGDAAAATLISASNDISKMGIGEFVFNTDGSGANNLIVKNGGMRNPIKNGIDYFESDNFVKNDDYLFMNGQEIFKFTTSTIPTLIDECLLKNNLNIDGIDLFIFHQANKFMLDYLKRKLNIPDSKFFIYLENCGNTVSSTIPIAISEAIKGNQLKKGMTLLVVGFGVGYSAAATILKI